ALAVAMVTPVLALDQPVVWRDPDTGCGYLLTPQGGVGIRYRADGTIDCPKVTQDGGSARGALDDMTKELGRGLDALRRELDRLR
ncbi:MAG: hypothetical protein M3O00_16070, partial [Pseudomonadota bacterium]|nr:hypothetical protein [Pseudomonadota bacterium]